MAILFTRLPAILWGWLFAHKAATAILAVGALAALMVGLDNFLSESTPVGWHDSSSRNPTANNEDTEQMERWLAEGIDTSSLMEEAVPGHIKELTDKDPAVRLQAAKALWQIGPDAVEAVPALLQAVNDPDPDVAAKTIEALEATNQRNPKVMRALVTAVKDPRAGVRAAAVAALTDIWYAENLPHRSFQEEQEEGKPKKRGAGSLGPHSEELALLVVPDLTEALLDPDPRVRAQVTAALGCIGPDARAAVSALADRLRREKDNGIRLITVIVLGQIHRDPELAVPVLVEAYLTSEGRLPGSALEALQEFGPAAAQFGIPILNKALKEAANHQDQDFLKRVAKALEIVEKAGKAP